MRLILKPVPRSLDARRLDGILDSTLGCLASAPHEGVLSGTRLAGEGAGETGLAFEAGSPDHHADGSRTLMLSEARKWPNVSELRRARRTKSSWISATF